MTSANDNAIRAVSRRAMEETRDALQDEVGGEWTLESARPSKHWESVFRGSVVVSGRPPGVTGPYLHYQVLFFQFLDCSTLTLIADITEQPSATAGKIAGGSLSPPLDDPDNEVERFLIDLGRQFVAIARAWRPWT
jgi:hypothetical protein